MVVIGLIGIGNVGKRTFLHLFVDYLINDEIEKGVNNSEFNIIKVDIDYNNTRIRGFQRSYRNVSPNRVILRERESNKAHTIFAPSKDSKRGAFKMNIITISRIANLVIPIFSLDQDIETQLEFFKEIKFLPENIFICLNKYDLLEGDTKEQDDKIEITKTKVISFFKKERIDVIDLFLTTKRKPDSFHQIFEIILDIIRSKSKSNKKVIQEKLEGIEMKETYSAKKESPIKDTDNEIIYKSRDLRKDEYILNIIVEGDSSSGNTTMLKRFLYNQFDASTRMTIGVQFFTAKLILLGKEVTIQFWDFAGRKRRASFQPYIYASSDSMMVVFDLTRAKTITNLGNIVEVAKNAGIESDRILLVGNKSDLTDQIVISDEFALKLVEEYNLCSYVKTSAKTGFNIAYAFKRAAVIAMFNRSLINKSDLKSYIDQPTN